MPKQRAVLPDRQEAKRILDECWATILDSETDATAPGIRELVNSDETAIRFCLPTQLLGKLTNNNLDALCLQRGPSGTAEGKRWDPRGFCQRVIVPWNGANQNVLGPSGDPYVSNSLRRPRLDFGLEQRADREQWESVCAILRDVETIGDQAHTRKIFIEVLNAIRDRLRDFEFQYVAPERISLAQAEQLVRRFLNERSGGDRGLSLAAALFETIGRRLNVYKEVRRGVINATDAAAKSVGDLECVDSDNRIVLAVEVKERKIGDDDVRIAVEKAREFAVRELIFCCDGVVQTEKEAVDAAFASAWASGTNLYQATITELMRGILPVLGEAGVKDFIVQVGRQLDRFSTQPKHRKAWKSLLDEL